MRPVILAALVIIVVLLSFQNCSQKLMTPDTPVVDYSSYMSVMPDCEFNGTGLMNGDTVKAYRTSTVPQGQSCQGQIRTCRNGVLSDSFEYGFCLAGAPAACLVDGRTIPHGGTIKAYEKSTVPYGQDCDQSSQIRTCNNGVLSGNFAFSACKVNKPEDCELNGVTIENGKSKRYYKDAVMPFGVDCVSEMRACDNKKLSGSFTNLECRTTGAQGCSLDGVTFGHGQSRPFYDRTTVPFDQTCPPTRTRTCNNTVIEGDSNYKFAICSPTPGANCTFDGKPVAHNSPEFDAWSAQTVPYGQSCNSVKTTRKCFNGVLSGGDAFVFPSCQEGLPTQTCTLADGGTPLTHGQTATVYTISLAQSPSTCATAGNPKTGFCDNGTLKDTVATGAPLTGERFRNCFNGDKHDTEWKGSNGGSPHSLACGAGQQVTGLFFGYDGRNPDIDSIGVLCNGVLGPAQGTSFGNPHHLNCPNGKSVVGVYGQTYPFLNYAAVICANPNGSGREQTGAAGVWLHNSSQTTWYQLCRPGYVVTRLMPRIGGTVDGFNMECTQVAVPANINCEGTWIDEGCTFGLGGSNLERYLIFQLKGGTGAECTINNNSTRPGSSSCGNEF